MQQARVTRHVLAYLEVESIEDGLPTPRSGWAEANRKLAAGGDGVLVLPWFANEDALRLNL